MKKNFIKNNLKQFHSQFSNFIVPDPIRLTDKTTRSNNMRTKIELFNRSPQIDDMFDSDLF